MTVKEIVIKNPTGLHARPASEFTRCAAGFKSKITVNRPGEKPVNAKSIIMVLAQSFIMGTTVVISADVKNNAARSSSKGGINLGVDGNYLNIAHRIVRDN